MKKATLIALLVSFLFAVSRPVMAGDNRGISTGALIGAAVGVITLGILTTAYSTSEREVTNRKAINEEHLTQREQIRASTVLAAPSALGGKGSASYSSPEGTARIEADAQPVAVAPAAPQYRPAPGPQPEYRQRQAPRPRYGNWCYQFPEGSEPFRRCMAPLM